MLAWNADDGKVLKTLTTNPPALPQRLAAAKSALEQAKNKSAVAIAASTDTQNKINTVKANQQKVADRISQTKLDLKALDGETTKFAAAQRRFSSLNLQRMQSLPADQAKLTKLKLALEQSKLALANLPDDQRLKETVAYLQAEIKWLDERNQQFARFVSANFMEHVRISKQLRDLQQRATLIEKTRDEKLVQTTTLNKRLNDLAANFEKVSKAKAAAEQEVALKQKSVDRWQGEIQFDQQLRQLRSQLEASEKQLAAKQQSIRQAQQQRQLADEKVKQAKRAADESRSAVEAIQMKLQQLRE